MTKPERHAEARAAVHHGHTNGPDTPVIALPFGPTAADIEIVGRDCILMGAALVETTGAATAAADFLNGLDATATLLLPFNLAAGQAASSVLSSWGLAVTGGLRLNVRAGSVRGVAWVILP